MSHPPSQQHEDYLERIYEIMAEKGSVRAVELAERLGVTPASVTQMLKRLEADGYLKRERYRGFALTKTGYQAGERIRQRHLVLLAFLRKLELSEEIIEHDIEGLEHYLSDETVRALEKLLARWPVI